MLADRPDIVRSGRLDRDIHLPSTAKLEMVGFIAEQLPLWRDHPDRPIAHAETRLTEHLCAYLNSATYGSADWSHIQFCTEPGDETRGRRTIDLAVKPRGVTIIIEHRRHNLFEMVFPIECKRLPTPRSGGRDEREYVTSDPRTAGGIQRFKLGEHGATHTFAAMIGYIQEETSTHWLNMVNRWIHELSGETDSIWSNSDALQLLTDDPISGVSTLESRHTRGDDLDECELRHLWISMN